ncbi:cation diffusion facilitator family transporter [Novisyntrophococcus fermenticellae]|uniref:cation diffusion facilitator family transporter n=1 Tax=Novisyntrophococcus fermenticellae TaxID=2068655 RepID=UPI001E2A28AA|nr:cation diffusion facilitator family transporter [Novisyntrophococcus fermenticellae]
MTELLVHKFIKDYDNTEDTQVRTSYGILTSVVGIFCNVLLFAVKFSIGLLLHSLAVTADAFNNLSDAASSIISFIGVKMASKPADEEHPFGHGRIEYIAALIVSFLIMEVGLTFLKSSVGKVMHPEELAFEWIPFLILVLSIGVKLWLGAFNRKLGNRIDSKVMLAAAADSMGDVLTTSATIISILICRFTSVNVDAYAGIIVSAIVMWAGFSIAKDTLEPLIGQGAPRELYQKISEAVEAYDGIVGTHDLIVHNYGPSHSMASIHAEVPNNVDIEVSHEIIDRVEREVSKQLNITLVIHMDPVETQDKKVLEVKAKVARVIKALDPKLKFHDFRMVSGEEHTNLIFDLVIPREYSKENAERILQQVIALMQEVDSRYQCVITMDKSYVAE